MPILVLCFKAKSGVNFLSHTQIEIFVSLSMLFGVEGEGETGNTFPLAFFDSSFLFIILKPGTIISYLASLVLVKAV